VGDPGGEKKGKRNPNGGHEKELKERGEFLKFQGREESEKEKGGGPKKKKIDGGKKEGSLKSGPISLGKESRMV